MLPGTRVVPKPAATVVILRDRPGGDDGPGGVDVWLMRRHPTMSFAPAMHVFPGGGVDPGDHDPTIPFAGSPDASVEAFDVAPDLARAVLSAAVRETFEESGVLLTVGDEPPVTTGTDWETRRLGLLTGNIGWAELLQATGYAIDASALVPWARWVTPEWSPRRFDAFFYVVRLPEGQEPRWVPGEADRAGWFDVADTVARHADGEVPMMLPTIAVLTAVARHGRVADVLAARPDRVEVDAG